MKNIFLFALILLTAACQKEEFTVVEGQEEASFLADGQLTGLIQSVAAHDGSFDDIVDQSPCFSINFPYQVTFKGTVYTINSVADLSIFKEGDVVEPVFPIEISFANYQKDRIASSQAFTEYIQKCEDGLMYNDRITCVDFVYPIDVSVYDPVNSDFDLISFQHDKQTFTTIDDMDRIMIASIRFPIQLITDNGTRMEIAGNEDLKATILGMLPLCD
jgi:hypothetical protein